MVGVGIPLKDLEASSPSSQVVISYIFLLLYISLFLLRAKNGWRVALLDWLGDASNGGETDRFALIFSFAFRPCRAISTVFGVYLLIYALGIWNMQRFVVGLSLLLSIAHCMKHQPC